MANTVYTVTITTGATSTQGTPLAADYTWFHYNANSNSYRYRSIK
jgi:hypothetical protein